jgi:glycerophosphoryl diester phosphodiesterase
VLTIAHRGYSAAYPENTTLAFERAMEAGAECIETDVRLSRDCALVCSHDPDLKRMAGDGRSIADLDLDELQSIALLRDQRLLTLTQVLLLARGRARVMLDVKVTTLPMIEAIAGVLGNTGMARDVVYGARTAEHLRAVAERLPALDLLAMPATPELVPGFLAHEPYALRFWEDEATPERIEHAHRSGCKVWVTAGVRSRQEAPGYTTAHRAAALMQLGVDGLLLNDPPLVQAAAGLIPLP